MKNTVITIIATIVVLSLIFAALAKFDIIELGHNEQTGQPHINSAGHDDCSGKDDHSHAPVAPHSCSVKHDHSH